MKALPVIAVTSGEPAGIGPDICLALAAVQLPCRKVILADRDLLAARAAQLGLAARLRAYDPARAGAADELEVLHLPLAAHVTAGRLDPANSAYVLALLRRAVAGCSDGTFAAMVTAPVHKGVINDAGFAFTGHPALRHLYLPAEFEGYPLRKDFPLLAREVKPWPGLVDVEPMPGEEGDDEDPAVEGGA